MAFSQRAPTSTFHFRLSPIYLNLLLNLLLIPLRSHSLSDILLTCLRDISAFTKMGNPVGPGMFKAALAETPREAFNWRLAFSVICFGLMVQSFEFSELSH